MLIELSDDFQGQWHTGDEALFTMLKMLALAYREGNHNVTGSHAILEELINCPDLTAQDRSTFRQIRARLQDSQALRERVRYLITVQPGSDLRREDLRDQTRFLVPPSFFKRSSRIQMSDLIAEHDEHDGAIYLLVGQSYASRFLPTVLVQATVIGGGGGTTVNHVKRSAKNGLALCIVDSDRTHPDAGLGDTAEPVKSAVDGQRCRAAIDAFILPVRMIENLFPQTLVDAAFQSHCTPNQQEVLSTLCSVVKPHGELGSPELAYLKLKTHLLLHTELSTTNDQLKAHLRQFREKLALPPPTRGVWCSDRCAEKARHKCRCVLVPGLDLMKPVVAFCAANPDRATQLLFESPYSAVWREIGHRVASFCCGIAEPRV